MKKKNLLKKTCEKFTKIFGNPELQTDKELMTVTIKKYNSS